MIKKKYLLNKVMYEKNGQLSFFGRDNLSFKTVNMEKKQRFINLCTNFKLKILIRNTPLSLYVIKHVEQI